MALDQDALLELLEALRAADVEERIRSAATAIYQALIEAELTAVIGAGPNERTPQRLAQRNGHCATPNPTCSPSLLSVRLRG